MNITFSTIVNTILFSGVAILLLEYVISKKEILLRIGISAVLFLMMILMIRFFLPIELPIQRNIDVKKVWPDIYVSFVIPRFLFWGNEWSILNILTVISIVGSIFFVVKLVCSYHFLSVAINKYDMVSDPIIIENINKINATFKKPKIFKVVEWSHIDSPIIFGLYKPCIILPKIDLLEEEWFYVLSHEMSHFYFKDLWIRVTCQLLQAIYWWNPFIYLLRNQITKVQELRVDSAVIKHLEEIKKLEYLECLIKVAKLQVKHERMSYVAAFSSDSENEVSKRIHSIYQFINGNQRSFKSSVKSVVIGLLLILSIFVIPNFFIVEPFSRDEDDIEGTYTAEEIYLIQKSDGTYDFYANDVYIGTITELHEKFVNIYNEKGELIE